MELGSDISLYSSRGTTCNGGFYYAQLFGLLVTLTSPDSDFFLFTTLTTFFTHIRIIKMSTNTLETFAWPTCPEEFTRVIKPRLPLPSTTHKNGPNTTATSPLTRTNALQPHFTSSHDSTPPPPYTLLDHVLASSTILLTPPLSPVSLAPRPKEAPSRIHRYLVPPVGGYKDNKLDYKLKPRVKKAIEMLDSRGPNSDLGGGQSYEKDFVDLNGDITMQEIIWTTKAQTLFLVSLPLSHRGTTADQMQRRRFDTVLISSTMDGIPSLVITAPEETTMPEPVNNSSNAPRSKRNKEYDQDIPVYANGVWAPVDIKKRKGNN
jgi:hypothetical protein